MFVRRENGKWSWGMGDAPPCPPEDGWHTARLGWPLLVLAVAVAAYWTI